MEKLVIALLAFIAGAIITKLVISTKKNKKSDLKYGGGIQKDNTRSDETNAQTN